MTDWGSSDYHQEEEPKCDVIPGVFYPAAEANKLLEMIRPLQPAARRLVQENPEKDAISEWFMRAFQLCHQKSGLPRPKI